MQIIVYTQDGCRFCRDQKKWMDVHNINYSEKNILQNKDFQNEFIRYNPLGVPYTIIETDGEFEGFSGFTPKLKKILKKKNLS